MTLFDINNGNKELAREMILILFNLGSLKLEIQVLVKHGAKMEDLDEKGRTVLQRAVNCSEDGFSYTQPDVIKKLLDLGAATFSDSKSISVAAQPKQLETLSPKRS